MEVVVFATGRVIGCSIGDLLRQSIDMVIRHLGMTAKCTVWTLDQPGDQAVYLGFLVKSHPKDPAVNRLFDELEQQFPYVDAQLVEVYRPAKRFPAQS